MADTTVERLITLIEANTRSYENAMKKLQSQTEQAIRGSSKAFQSLDSKIAALGNRAKMMAGAFGISLGLSEIPGQIRDIVADAAGLVDTADKLGLATEALQKLRFAGTQAGVEIKEMDSALSFFARQIGEASRGAGDLHPILSANNVALRDQSGAVRPLADIFQDYIRVMENAGSSQERAVFAVKAFGRAADEMGNMTSAGVRLAGDELQRLGGIIDDAKLRRIAEIDDQWDKFATTLRVKFRSAVLDVVTVYDTLLDRMNKVEDQQTRNVQAALADVYAKRSDLQGRIAGFEGSPAAATPRGNATLIKLKEQLEELTQQALQLRDILDRRLGYNPEGTAEGEPAPGAPIPRAKPTRTSVLPPAPDNEKAAQAKRFADLKFALESEAAAVGKSAREQAILNDVQRLGAQATADQVAKIRELSGALYDSALRTKEFDDALRSTGEAAFDTFGNIASGATDAKQAIMDLIKQLLLAEAKSLFLSAIGVKDVAAGPISSLLSGLTGRASGGQVAAGTGYQVNERGGREIFIPNTSGRILSHADAMSRGGGGSARVEIALAGDIDARIARVSGPIAVSVSRDAVGSYHKARMRAPYNGSDVAGVMR